MPGLLDQVDPYAGGYSLMEDPFEAAARRQRQAVMPIGGRQEGWLTENPDFGMVVPRSPADVALLAAGGPLGRAAKVAALAGAGVLSSDEAQAGKVSALKDIISRAGGAVKGGAFSKKSGEVLDEIAAGPKGAGPMDLSTSAQIPDVPQVPMERWQPPRGVSQRMQDALANREVSTGILGTIDRGIGLGADKWYHTEPVRQAWINELGPVAGPREFARYMDMVAATSPRSDVPTNIRNASYYYQHAAAGKELPDTLPYPYGHVAQNLHRQNYETLTAARPGALSSDVPATSTAWNIFKNPKPASFSQNLQGNLAPGTMDTHAFRNIGMRTNDPRFLETSLSAKYKMGSDPSKDTIVGKYGEYSKDKVTFRPQKLFESGRLSLEEAKGIPYFWASKPNPNEYGAAEDLYRSLGAQRGLPTADAQAAAWAGGGDLTGLGTVATHTFPELLNERVLYTARMRNENPSDTLRKFIRGERPLLGIGGASAVGATQMNTSDAPGLLQ